jgi:hypothetical protein
MQDDLPPATREMHLSFESLAIINTPSLQVFLMDIHHNTSFRSILEDDSISLASKAHIHSCSCKKVGLWLIVRPSIHSYRIAYFIFTSTLHFHFSLIQPSTSSLFTCECGHKLDASNTHLTCCLFEGQRIATHDAIQDVMYALARENGHVIWKERWYALMSRISL